jgi:hypothetical protein
VHGLDHGPGRGCRLHWLRAYDNLLKAYLFDSDTVVLWALGLSGVVLVFELLYFLFGHAHEVHDAATAMGLSAGRAD